MTNIEKLGRAMAIGDEIIDFTVVAQGEKAVVTLVSGHKIELDGAYWGLDSDYHYYALLAEYLYKSGLFENLPDSFEVGQLLKGGLPEGSVIEWLDDSPLSVDQDPISG